MKVCVKGIICCLLHTISVAAFDVDRQIAILLKVGNEGKGNEEAQDALRKLEKADGALLKLLSAMKDANQLGLNWLKAGADAIVEQKRLAKKALPFEELGEFLLDLQQHPRARLYAFELIASSFPETSQRLLRGMINDPSLDLRRDAVGQIIKEARRLKKNGRDSEAIILFRQALNSGRDQDQIDGIASALQELNQAVDLPSHFGFLMNWKVIGPFDNSDRRGFGTAFPPEKELRLDRSYPTKFAKSGMAKWQEMRAKGDYGMLDMNLAFGQIKEATAYAFTNFESDSVMNVELRLGCKNAWKLWLNGELLFGRDEYHRGMRIDQYRMKGTLKKGENHILIKLCQNEQIEDWTVEWQFQLRVCDATGTAILASNRTSR